MRLNSSIRYVGVVVLRRESTGRSQVEQQRVIRQDRVEPLARGGIGFPGMARQLTPEDRLDEPPESADHSAQTPMEKPFSGAGMCPAGHHDAAEAIEQG